MREEPAETIRQHIETHGETEATVQHLLTTFDIHAADEPGRCEIAAALATRGVQIDRPIEGLDLADAVRLTLAGPVVAAEPTQIPIAPASPVGQTTSAGRRTPLPVVAGLVVLAAAVGGLVGYPVGRSGGENLDAASTAGAAQGRGEGAARGARTGFDSGFKQGREAGYKATYRRAYRRAYGAALQAQPSAEPTGNPGGQQPGATPEVTPPPGSRYESQLPNNKPGYILPEAQRSLSCIGIDAQTGQCVGD